MKVDNMVLSQRFCGPPKTGNGGFTADILVEAMGTNMGEIRLLGPTPCRDIHYSGIGKVRTGNDLRRLEESTCNVEIDLNKRLRHRAVIIVAFRFGVRKDF